MWKTDIWMPVRMHIFDKQTAGRFTWLFQYPRCHYRCITVHHHRRLRSLILKTCYPVHSRNRSHDSFHATAGDLACCKRWGEHVSKRELSYSLRLCLWFSVEKFDSTIDSGQCDWQRWVADLPHASFFFSKDVVDLHFFYPYCCFCHCNVFGLGMFLCLQSNWISNQITLRISAVLM